jgi:hypothetical protein
LVANGIFVLIWGWILNWLCSKGLKAISWVLVLLPFIFFIFTFFLAKDIMSNATDEEGFREGAQDCVIQPDGSRACQKYDTQKEADAAKKKREKDAAAAKLAKETPSSRDKEMAAMYASEEARIKREKAVADKAAADRAAASKKK